MNKTFTFLAVAALMAGSTMASAQPARTSFADTFAEMQAVSSNSSQWQPRQALVTARVAGPRDRVALADYQALASNSSQWQLDQGPVVVDGGPTFAQTHPRGIAFAEYQALASNSGEFQNVGDGGITSSFASTGAAQGAVTAGLTLRDRWARLFRRTDATTQNN